ncbi:MAG: FAD-dependent oxidoreductase [Desulfobacterales bacterium]|nr:FAD-dependent oxidoreductase [Desulfobacterales bacterium]
MTKNKLLTLDDLKVIEDRVCKERKKFQFQVMLCGGTPCQASDSLSIKKVLAEELAAQGMTDRVKIVETGCMAFCAVGPVMTVYPNGYFYQKLKSEDMAELVASHFKKETPLERLMYKDPNTGQICERIDQIPYLALQKILVLKNGGMIDPENIDEYIWRGGYKAAFNALNSMTSREIINEVKLSGLRGRGGGGFPTGVKWEFCASTKGDVKYVLCNADEGDPGAFMDRSVMESDPHSVLEGMIIAGKAIGAHKGYIYCRAEYPLAIKRLHIAIAQAKEYGLLGKDILGSGFDLEIEIYQGAGAFVCGEETALMTSIEGRRGMPRPRPPFPAVAGLWQKPSVLNNVETFASISYIILNGGETFAKIGTEAAKGTKIFSLSGKLKNFGLAEVPMGTPIGKVIFDIGGGIINNKKFKAVQLGGPSGGCLPAEHLNLPIDYEAIIKAGAIMGSGGMIVMDEDTCMVDMARFFMDFCQDESCGKCTACRIGTRRMLEILQRICRGDGREGDIELLCDLAQSIKDTALCGLGQTAPNPVLSTIRYFRDEYEAHIHGKRCPAVVCSQLFASPCQHMCPVGMNIPAYVALVRANRFDDAYRILKKTNPFPSVCGRVCGHPCQSKCRRSQLDESVAIKHLKRFITDNGKRPEISEYPVTRLEKIAVVGAGPGGLSCALDLKKRGYAVTVFESMPKAGGMLRWGIPEYRLPREVLDQEIADITATGVQLKTNIKVGKDITFGELDKDFDAIFISVGAQKSSALGIPGEDAKGVFGAIELLKDYNLGKSLKFGKNVAVIGGGNSAIDAARVAIRSGAEDVTIFYRRERKDMPAQEIEIKAAEEEGVKFVYLVGPTQILVSNGAVSGIELVSMKLGKFDNSGRKRPEPISGSNFKRQVDMVIAAIGQATDLSLIAREPNIAINKGVIKVDRNLKTTHAKVWAGGDVVTGPAMVIDAIKAGQDAAKAIDNSIRLAKGEKLWIQPKEEEIDIPFEVDAETIEQPQKAMREIDVAERRGNFKEVEIGYTIEMALSEARRCMRCDAKLK